MKSLKLTGAKFLIKTANEIGNYSALNGIQEKNFTDKNGRYYKGNFYNSWKWLKPVVQLIEKRVGTLNCNMTLEYVELLDNKNVSDAFKKDFKLFWYYIAVLQFIEKENK